MIDAGVGAGAGGGGWGLGGGGAGEEVAEGIEILIFFNLRSFSGGGAGRVAGVGAALEVDGFELSMSGRKSLLKSGRGGECSFQSRPM